ncbi:MAG: hypothetical protein ABIQ06_15035 [Caldimonas sp.]
MHPRDSRRRAALVVLVAPLILSAVVLSAHAQVGAAKAGEQPLGDKAAQNSPQPEILKAEDSSKTSPLPPPREWVGPFPIPSGATPDPRQSGMTSLSPGRNYVFATYTIERPRAEIVRFYESTMKKFQRSEGPDGSVRLKTDEGSVQLAGSGRKTRIHITHGPQ